MNRKKKGVWTPVSDSNSADELVRMVVTTNALRRPEYIVTQITGVHMGDAIFATAWSLECEYRKGLVENMRPGRQFS